MFEDDMASQDSHLSDVELLQAADGELSPSRQIHLSRCWECRVRKQDTDRTIADFVRLRRDMLDPLLPPSAGPRALLKARLGQVAGAPRPWWHGPAPVFGKLIPAGLLIVFAAAVASHYRPLALPISYTSRSVPISIPEPSLTPGAITTADRDEVCEVQRPKNVAVPASLQKKVFDEYGIPVATARAYEVDYLITPALGGADDIRNLWPQSYSQAVWNARVKDALEDKLHDLVCEGNLDLIAAQHDLSSDWIAAYKKYFHTDEPLTRSP